MDQVAPATGFQRRRQAKRPVGFLDQDQGDAGCQGANRVENLDGWAVVIALASEEHAAQMGIVFDMGPPVGGFGPHDVGFFQEPQQQAQFVSPFRFIVEHEQSSLHRSIVPGWMKRGNR